MILKISFTSFFKKVEVEQIILKWPVFRNPHFDYSLRVISALWVGLVNGDVLIKLLWIIFLVHTAVSNYMIIAYKANNWNHVLFYRAWEKVAHCVTIKQELAFCKSLTSRRRTRNSHHWGNSCRNVSSGVTLIPNNRSCLRAPFTKQIFKLAVGQLQKHSVKTQSMAKCFFIVLAHVLQVRCPQITSDAM